VAGVDIGEHGAMTSRTGHIYQLLQSTKLGGEWSAMAPMFAPANKTPTMTM